MPAPTPTPAPTRLLSMRAVLALTGFKSPDTVYRLEREGKFPRHLKISERASRWREDEVTAWIEARSAERPAVA